MLLEKKPSEEKVWLKHYESNAETLASQIPNNKTLWDVIEETIFEYESIPAISYFKREMSRAEYREMVYNWARTFRSMGIEENDIVPIYGTFTPSISAMILALNMIGACPNLLKLGLTKDKYEKETNDSKVMVILDVLYDKELKELVKSDRFKKVIITSISDDMLSPKKEVFSVLSYFKSLKSKIYIPSDPKYIWYNDAVQIASYYTGEVKVPFMKNRHSFITYSSGTTGEVVKGTIATNESAISQLLQSRYAKMGYETGKKCLTQFPPTASTALNCLFFAPLYSGMVLEITPSPKYTDYYKQVMETKPQFTISTGAVWKLFFNEYLKKGKNKSLDFLTVPVIGGDGATKEEIAWMNKILEQSGGTSKMCMGYGLSECFSVVTFDKPDLHIKNKTYHQVASVGIPYPGMQVGIFDESGNELGYNQRGELYVKSNSLMQGYYGKNDLTNKTFNDGWLKTGDICELDEDGQVFLYGRMNDAIYSISGKKIYLFDIANIIKEISMGAISSCIVNKYQKNGDTQELICHLTFAIDMKKEEVLHIIDKRMKKVLPADIKIICYKAHDSFKINENTLKVDRYQLDTSQKTLKKEMK